MVDVPPLAPVPAGFDADAWAAACAAVRSYCRWHVAPSVTETVTVDGTDSAILLLPTLRLTDLTAVTNDGSTVADPEWAENGVVRGSWTGRLRGVTATMTHGYDACPAEVLQIVKDMAAAAARQGQSGMVAGPFQAQYGQTSAGAEGGAVGISGQQEQRLAHYRLPARL